VYDTINKVSVLWAVYYLGPELQKISVLALYGAVHLCTTNFVQTPNWWWKKKTSNSANLAEIMP
jgi:hypothetical protein